MGSHTNTCPHPFFFVCFGLRQSPRCDTGYPQACNPMLRELGFQGEGRNSPRYRSETLATGSRKVDTGQCLRERTLPESQKGPRGLWAEWQAAYRHPGLIVV